MESPDPVIVTVDQPALSHDHAASTSVLAIVGLGGQVAFGLRIRAKKAAGPSARSFHDASKAPLLSEFTVHDAGAVTGIDPYVLGITA